MGLSLGGGGPGKCDTLRAIGVAVTSPSLPPPCLHPAPDTHTLPADLFASRPTSPQAMVEKKNPYPGLDPRLVWRGKRKPFFGETQNRLSLIYQAATVTHFAEEPSSAEHSIRHIKSITDTNSYIKCCKDQSDESVFVLVEIAYFMNLFSQLFVICLCAVGWFYCSLLCFSRLENFVYTLKDKRFVNGFHLRFFTFSLAWFNRLKWVVFKQNDLDFKE